MEKYNYYGSVEADVRNYVDEYLDNERSSVTSETKDEFYNELYDSIFVSDSVTGNGSGSYTFNAWLAEEHLCHNRDLLTEALEAFGCEPNYAVEKGAEACDVTIRCYLFPQFLDKYLDEIIEENEA